MLVENKKIQERLYVTARPVQIEEIEEMGIDGNFPEIAFISEYKKVIEVRFFWCHVCVQFESGLKLPHVYLLTFNMWLMDCDIQASTYVCLFVG